MSRPNTMIGAILVVAAALRLLCAAGLPLSGDEAGVTLLQSSGQAVGYSDRLPGEGQIVHVAEITKLIDYSERHSTADVISSLRYAGMHPPFYYLGLHLLLRYLGNDAFALRLISIILSLISVFLIYRLGNSVYGKNVGLYSAAFLALSSYGVTYGVFVKPYALAMLLALCSTSQIYEINETPFPSLRSKKLYVYLGTVLAGLYTIYHFLFVFAFHIVYSTAKNFKDKRALFTIISISVVTSLLYLPWIPSLLDQLEVVTSGNFYFHEPLTLWKIPTTILRSFVSPFPFLVKAVIATVTCLVALAGFLILTRDKAKRFFPLTILFYFLFNYIADMVMNSRTLSIEKLMFFTVPIFFVFLAVGISRLPIRSYIKNIATVAFCAILLTTSICLIYEKPVFGGPAELIAFRDAISKHLPPTQNGLVVIDTTARRYLFSFLHSLREPLDVKILDLSKTEEWIHPASQLEEYSVIFVINTFVTHESMPEIASRYIQNLSTELKKHGFEMVLDLGFKPRRNSLKVFSKVGRKN